MHLNNVYVDNGEAFFFSSFNPHYGIFQFNVGERYNATKSS